MIADLRAATSQLHKDLEVLMYTQEIVDGTLSQLTYLDLLPINHNYLLKFDRLAGDFSRLGEYDIKNSQLVHQDVIFLKSNALDPVDLDCDYIL